MGHEVPGVCAFMIRGACKVSTAIASRLDLGLFVCLCVRVWESVCLCLSLALSLPLSLCLSGLGFRVVVCLSFGEPYVSCTGFHLRMTKGRPSRRRRRSRNEGFGVKGLGLRV